VLSPSSYLIMARGLLYLVLFHSSQLIMARELPQMLSDISLLIMARELPHMLSDNSLLIKASGRLPCALLPPNSLLIWRVCSTTCSAIVPS
jgi:hypothetical protein